MLYSYYYHHGYTASLKHIIWQLKTSVATNKKVQMNQLLVLYQRIGCIWNSWTNSIHDGTIKVMTNPREEKKMRDLPISLYFLASEEPVFMDHSHIWIINLKANGYSRRPSNSPCKNSNNLTNLDIPLIIKFIS